MSDYIRIVRSDGSVDLIKTNGFERPLDFMSKENVERIEGFLEDFEFDRSVKEWVKKPMPFLNDEVE